MENNFDFSEIESNASKVKKVEIVEKKKRQVGSTKPLKFEKRDDNTELKAQIISMINDANLTYNDLYVYCRKFTNNDEKAAQKYAGNLISSLKNGHSMIDSTFALFCDFLGYDIILKEKKKVEKED